MCVGYFQRQFGQECIVKKTIDTVVAVFVNNVSGYLVYLRLHIIHARLLRHATVQVPQIIIFYAPYTVGIPQQGGIPR